MFSSKRDQEERRTGILMVLPIVILLSIFVVAPLIIAIYRSFFTGTTTRIFVGFDNYMLVLKNPYMIKSIFNVLLFSIIITVLQLLLSFFFAHVLQRVQNRLGVFIRTINYLPYLLSPIVVGVIFTLLTTYNGGVINSLLNAVGVESIAFNNDIVWSPISIIIPTIWIGFGYFSLVMYAGLINIPKTYYEAASIDGAGFFQTLRYITIPNMKNYFILLTVTLIVANLQMFEVPLMMTNGQPANRTMTPVLYLIHSRSNGNISEREIISASILIMIIIAIINSLVFSLTNRKNDSLGGE